MRSRATLDALLDSIQRVIDRHDILRTAVVWQELPQPVQVVWRTAQLSTEFAPGVIDSQASDLSCVLSAPYTQRLDVRSAPLLRARIMQDASQSRWLVSLLIHHLVCDHATLHIIMREVHSHLLGQPHHLPSPRPFRNFVARALRTVATHEHQSFFSEMLHDFSEPVVPLGLTASHGDGSRISERREQLPPLLSKRLRSTARAMGVSTASIFHVAWALLLARLSGREDVVFGTLLHGRAVSGDSAAALGLFTNTLPVRINVGGERHARSTVHETHDLLGRMIYHENASLALAQHCSAVPSGTPLFGALLNYRHSQPNGAIASFGGVQSIDLLAQSPERTNYPLTLSVDDLGENFALDAQVLAPADPRRICEFLVESLDGLLRALEQDSDVPLRTIHVLPAVERHRIVVDCNQTQLPHPECLLHELIEQQVQAAANQLAVVHNEDQLTYAELNERANQLAHRLRELGVGPGQTVVICMERGVEMIVAVLGILKAGGAYVPIDPEYPAKRVAYMLEDSRARVIITHQRLLDALPSNAATVIPLDAAWTEIATRSRNNIDPQEIGLESHDLAYVIYTSGSTGEPKGVMIEHRHVVSTTHARSVQYPRTEPDRFLLLAPLAFDSSVAGIFGTLSKGATLFIGTALAVRDPAGLFASLERFSITDLLCVPSLCQGLLAYLIERGHRLRLHRLIVAGETCSPRLVLDWQKVATGGRLFNEYGATEVAVWASVSSVETTSPVDDITVGRPIANARIYVLDHNRQPVPMGVHGEICLGGEGVGRGYKNRDELTTARFVPDPFNPAPGARMYRTGDIGRWRSDGQLECLGRRDHQVKIRGHRIELGEIEAHLSRHPQVSEAVVSVRDDSSGSRTLVGYVICTGDTTPRDLRAHLAETLPAHMVPSAFVVLPAFPLTPNGKIDRKALPAPDSDSYQRRDHEPPVGATEQMLANLWEEVLGVQRVGRHDNFFDLGGHSLLALRLFGRLPSEHELSIETLFEHPTVAAFARCLEEGVQVRLHNENLVRLRSGGDESPIFLVHDGTGSVLSYALLAKLLRIDAPIYGLPLKDWNGISSTEALAARHVSTIRGVQPHGPYRIGGWSFGAQVAYEIAYQLLGADEPVELVAMIDGAAPTGGRNLARLENEVAMLVALLTEVWQDEETMPDPRVLAELEHQSDLTSAVQFCEQRRLLPRGLNVSEVSKGIATLRIVAGIADRYCPHPIPAPVHSFLAAEAMPHLTRDWSPYVGGRLRSEVIGGSHRSILKLPHVQRLADSLSSALASPVPVTAVDSSVEPSTVVPIQLNESRTAPIFCVPGAAASSTDFLQFAQALGAGYAVYGLHARGLDDDTVPHSSVESAARINTQAIRSIVPHGPYRLVGHSFGGWIALEMALQLASHGARVDPLVIVDTELPNSAAAACRCLTRLDMFGEFIDLLERRTGRRLNLELRQLDALDNDAQIALLQRRVQELRLFPTDPDGRALRRVLRVFAANSSTTYQPASKFDGKVLVLLAEGVAGETSAPDMEQITSAWRSLAADVTLQIVPGNHFTILDAPQVERWAPYVRNCWAPWVKSVGITCME